VDGAASRLVGAPAVGGVRGTAVGLGVPSIFTLREPFLEVVVQGVPGGGVGHPGKWARDVGRQRSGRIRSMRLVSAVGFSASVLTEVPPRSPH
jgi:hypothetical protein